MHRMSSFTGKASDHQGSNRQQWNNYYCGLDAIDDYPTDLLGVLPFSEEVAQLVVTCVGNINDADLQEKLKCMQKKISFLAKTDQEDVVISKVEPWNSIRVTFNIPPDAAIRLRQLAQNGDHALQQLGILSVQIEHGDIIQVPASAAAGQPHQQAQQHVAVPVMSEATQPVTAASVPALTTPSRFPSEMMAAIQQSPLMSASVGIPQSSISQPMQGIQSQMQGIQSQLRPPIDQNQQVTQQQQMSGIAEPQFGEQSIQQQVNPPVSGIPWGGMQETQQRQQQMRQNIWNQMPIPNLVPFKMPSSIPQQQQQQQQRPPPKPKKKKRARKKKDKNEPRPPVGQPLLPVPDVPQIPHMLQDPSENCVKPELSLPPTNPMNNPISPNTSPATVPNTATTVPGAMPQGTQFPFVDVKQLQRQLSNSDQPPTTITQAQMSLLQQQQLHRQLSSSGYSQKTITQALSLLQQQQQQLHRKADVTLTSPLLVNLLQNEITTTQFPFVNPAGKGINTATTTMASLSQDGHTQGRNGQLMPEMSAETTIVTSSAPSIMNPNVTMPNVSLGLAMTQLVSMGQASQHPQGTAQQIVTGQQPGQTMLQEHSAQSSHATIPSRSTPQPSQQVSQAGLISQGLQIQQQGNLLATRAGQILTQPNQMMSQAGPSPSQPGQMTSQPGQIQPQLIQGMSQQEGQISTQQGLQNSNQTGIHSSQLPRYQMQGVSQAGQMSSNPGQQMMQLGQRLPQPYQMPTHPNQMQMHSVQMMLQQSQRQSQPGQMMQPTVHQGQMMALGVPMTSHMGQMTSQQRQVVQQGQMQQQQHPGLSLHPQGQMTTKASQIQSSYGNQTSLQIPSQQGQMPVNPNQIPSQQGQMPVNPNQMMRHMSLQQPRQRIAQPGQRFPQPGQRYQSPGEMSQGANQQMHTRPPSNPMSSQQGSSVAQFNHMGQMQHRPGQPGQITSQAGQLPGQIGQMVTHSSQIPGYHSQLQSQAGQINTQPNQLLSQVPVQPNQAGTQSSTTAQSNVMPTYTGAMSSQAGQQLAKLSHMTSQAGIDHTVQQEGIRTNSLSQTTTHPTITHAGQLGSVSQITTSSQHVFSQPSAGEILQQNSLAQPGIVGATSATSKQTQVSKQFPANFLPSGIERQCPTTMYQGQTSSTTFTRPVRPPRGRGVRGRGRGSRGGRGGAQKASKPLSDMSVPPDAIPEVPAFDEETALACMTEEERDVMDAAKKIGLEAKRESLPNGERHTQQTQMQHMAQRSELGYATNVGRASPIANVPRLGSPRGSSPRGTSPRGASPVTSAYMGVSPRIASPRVPSPVSGGHRGTSPRSSSPRSSSPRVASPRAASPMSLSPRGPSPNVSSPLYSIKTESGSMQSYSQSCRNHSIATTSDIQSSLYFGHPNRQQLSAGISGSYPSSSVPSHTHVHGGVSMKPESTVMKTSSQNLSGPTFNTMMNSPGPSQHTLPSDRQLLPSPKSEQYEKFEAADPVSTLSMEDPFYSLQGMMQDQQIGLHQQQQVTSGQGVQLSKPAEVRIPNPLHQGMQSVPPLPDAENFAQEIQRLAFGMGVGIQRTIGQSSTPRMMTPEGISYMHKLFSPSSTKKTRTSSPKGEASIQQGLTDEIKKESDPRLKALLNEIRPDACPVTGNVALKATGSVHGISNESCPMANISLRKQQQSFNSITDELAQLASTASSSSDMSAFLNQHPSQQVPCPELNAKDLKDMETLFGNIEVPNLPLPRPKQPALPLLTSAIKDSMVKPVPTASLSTQSLTSQRDLTAPFATESHGVFGTQISSATTSSTPFATPSATPSLCSASTSLSYSNIPTQSTTFSAPSVIRTDANITNSVTSEAVVTSQNLSFSSTVHLQVPSELNLQETLAGQKGDTGMIPTDLPSITNLQCTGLSDTDAGRLQDIAKQAPKTSSVLKDHESSSISLSTQSDGKYSPETILSARSVSPSGNVSPGSTSSTFSSASALLSSMAKTAASGTCAIPSISPGTENQQTSGVLEDMDHAAGVLNTPSGTTHVAPKAIPQGTSDSAMEALKQTTQSMASKVEESNMSTTIEGTASASPSDVHDVAPTLPKLQQQPDTLRVKSMSAPKSPRSPGEPPKLVPQSIMSVPNSNTSTISNSTQSSYITKPPSMLSSAPVLKPQMSAPMPTSLKSTLPSLDYSPKVPSNTSEGTPLLPKDNQILPAEDSSCTTKDSEDLVTPLEHQVAKTSCALRPLQKLPGETPQPNVGATGTTADCLSASDNKLGQAGVSVSEFYQSQSHLQIKPSTESVESLIEPLGIQVPQTLSRSSQDTTDTTWPIENCEVNVGAKIRKRTHSGDDDDKPLKHFKEDLKIQFSKNSEKSSTTEVPAHPQPSCSLSPNANQKQNPSFQEPTSAKLAGVSLRKSAESLTSHVRTRSSSGSNVAKDGELDRKDASSTKSTDKVKLQETETAQEQPTRTLRQRPDSHTTIKGNVPGRRSPAETLRSRERDEISPSTRSSRGLRGERDTSPDAPNTRKRSTRSVGKADTYYGPIPSYKRRKANQK